MKVLILNSEYPPLGGGAATATQNLLKEYATRKDMEVTLVTSSVGEYHKEKLYNNVTIHYLDIGKTGDLHHQSNKDLLRYSLRAYLWLRRNNLKDYSLIHAFFGVPCGFIAMLMGLPYIVSLRGSDVPFYSEKFKLLDKYIFQYLDRYIWRNAKKVVANSLGLRNLAYKTYNKKKIEVIYNGVDTNSYFPAKGTKKKFVVISTSRLTKRKGLRYLIEGFYKFSENKSNVELRFFGDGEQRKDLEEFVHYLNLSEKVKFLGETDRAQIQEELRKAKVFVLPSLNEGMSNSLLEAMASGLPVIATDVGGTKELVNQSNGFIIRKESSEDIEKALEELYRDEYLLVTMGMKSRSIAEKMSWSNMAEEYIKLYKIIDSKSNE